MHICTVKLQKKFKNVHIKQVKQLNAISCGKPRENNTEQIKNNLKEYYVHFASLSFYLLSQQKLLFHFYSLTIIYTSFLLQSQAHKCRHCFKLS